MIHGVTHGEWLERRAASAIREGGRIPLDLHYEMLGVGLNTEVIERQLQSQINEETHGG